MSLTQSQERVFAIVSVAENGIAAKTVAKQMHLSIMRISEVLRELRNLGLVKITSRGPLAVWCTLDRVARVRAAIAADVEECRSRRDQVRLAALKLQRDNADAWPEDETFRRVLRPAAGAPLPRTRAVRSVFELAAV